MYVFLYHFGVLLRREISGDSNGFFETIVQMLTTSGHCRTLRMNLRVRC